MTPRKRVALVLTLLRPVMTAAKHPVFVYRPDENISYQISDRHTTHYGGTRNRNNGGSFLPINGNTCQTNAQCLNGGSCKSQIVQGSDAEGENPVFVHRCVCMEGYSGSRCEEYCPLDCENGGVCHRMPSGVLRGGSSNSQEGPAFHCKCFGYFTGQLCTVAYENCLDGTKCYNGGTCRRMGDVAKTISSLTITQENDRVCDCPPTHSGRYCHLETNNGKIQYGEWVGEPTEGPSIQSEEDEQDQDPNHLEVVSEPTVDPSSPLQQGDESSPDSISTAQVGDESVLDSISPPLQQGDELALGYSTPPQQGDPTIDSSLAPQQRNNSLTHHGDEPTTEFSSTPQQGNEETKVLVGGRGGKDQGNKQYLPPSNAPTSVTVSAYETQPPPAPVALLNASMALVCLIIMFTILLFARRFQRRAIENGWGVDGHVSKTSTFSSQDKPRKNDPWLSSSAQQVVGGVYGMNLERRTYSVVMSMSSPKSDGTVLEGYPLPTKEGIWRNIV